MQEWVLVNLPVTIFLVFIVTQMSKHMDTEPKEYFIYSVLFTITWLVFDLLFQVSPTDKMQLFAGIALMGLSLAASGFFLSCLSFRRPVHLAHVLLSTTPVFLLAYALFDYQFANNAFGYYQVMTWNWVPWLASITLLIMYGLYVLTGLRHEVEDPTVRKRLDTYILGISLLFTLPFTNFLLVQLLPLPNANAPLASIGLGICYLAFRKK
jgi:hypothetical protein